VKTIFTDKFFNLLNQDMLSGWVTGDGVEKGAEEAEQERD
jgi:hypothetical protein